MSEFPSPKYLAMLDGLRDLNGAETKMFGLRVLAETLDDRGEKCAAKAAKIGRHQAELSPEVRELLARATTFQECAGLIREALK